jgi:Tol biopolymer transport system component
LTVLSEKLTLNAMSRPAAICAAVSILVVAAAQGGATAAPADVTELAYIGKIPELRQPALYLINSDGSDRRLITPRGGVARHFTFSWAPDGQQIAYSGFIGHNEDAGEIFVVNADGSDLRQLTHSSPNRKRTLWDWSANPTWSPDGKLIAFEGSRKCGVQRCRVPQIYVIGADGTGEHALTSSLGAKGFPAWSPDGRKILFERYGGRWVGPGWDWIDNAQMDLYTIDPEGHQKRKVARVMNELYHCACPAWSPDSSQIVYEAAGTNGKSDLYVIKADGSGQKRLTQHRARDENPDWSPDGTQIAFYSERVGDAEIYVMNADGTSQHRITHDPWYDQAVRWRPLPK